jgi:hypothetical protein
MITWKKNRIPAVLIIALAYVGCGEAPRDNARDPLSPNYENRGALLVRVQSFYPPRAPLAGVQVSLSPGNVFLITNAEGVAVFPDLASQKYLLIAHKQGYIGDSVQVEVQAGQVVQHAFQLNAVPHIAGMAIYSERISRWFPINRDLNRLVVAAQVSDADGAQDIDTVKLLSKNYGVLGNMAFRSASGKYELILEESELRGRSLFDFVGEPLQIEAHDRAGARVLSTALAMARVIETTPTAEAPANLTTTGTRPRFRWRSSSVPYEFTFRVDVSQFEPQQRFATLFESVAGISSDSSAYLTVRDLPGGVYYWTVSIIDRHGNLSRSREATFEVSQ